jgi:hypothetical protein
MACGVIQWEGTVRLRRKIGRNSDEKPELT